MPAADSALDGFVESRKAEQQVKLDAISARLSREVMANYASFIDGMRQISEIDMDVSRASIHVSNSLRKLSSAKESLVVGTLGITYRRRRCERLADLRARLAWLRALLRVEDDVAAACAAARFADAVRAVVDGAARLRDPAAALYTAAPALRSRFDGALASLQDRMQAALESQLVSFDAGTYAAVLLAFRDLDAAGFSRSARANERDRAGTVAGGDDPLSGFSAGAGAADDDADAARAGPRSLLEEVGSSIASTTASASAGLLAVRGIGGVDSNLAALPARVAAAAAKAVKALSKDALIDLLLKDERARVAAAARGGGGGDDDDAAGALPPEHAYAARRAELRQRSFHDLAGSVPPEDVPGACVRVSSAIAHVMHQHFLLLQWHRAPLDARAGLGEMEWLHRCAATDADPEEEAAAAGGSGSGRGARAPADAALADTLAALRPFLLRGRSVVWQHMQQRFSALLFGSVSVAGVSLPVERLAQCLVVARDMMVVGVEFVAGGDAGAGAAGASFRSATAGGEGDACGTLRGSLRLLCSQYMDAIHGESFENLRALFARETWVRVPLSAANFAGVLEAATAGARAAFSKPAQAAMASATAAILGQDAAGGGGDDDGAPDAAAADASGAPAWCRAYSDGASLFSHWLERGNPFGAFVLEAAPGVAGGVFALRSVTVAPTPRAAAPGEDDDDDADDDDDDAEDAERKANPALAKRRAAARLMRRMHGEGYTLDVGVGRKELVFGLGPIASAADEGGSDGDSDESPVLVDSGASSASDDDDDDDDAGGGAAARRRRAGKGGAADGDAGAFGAGAGPFAAIFGADTTHVATAAALTGFAKAVGRYVLIMEVLPTVATDAFTGLAKLFELYLFTVATVFLRPPAQRQLFDVAAPVPSVGEREVNSTGFDYLDGSAIFVAARVAAAAADARAAGDAAALGSGGGGSGARLLRRVNASGGYSGMSSGGGDANASFDSDGSRRAAKRGGAGAGSDADADTATLHGVTLHLRGLPALAQAQGLGADFYAPGGGGADAAAQLGGNANNSDALFITLRRALQQIGAALHAGGRVAGGASVLADGVFDADTPASRPGAVPEPFCALQAGVEIDGEAAAHGIVERCVAAESLEFLLDVLARVRGRIESHLPPAQGASVLNFFARAVQCTTQLRGLVYHSMVPRILPESGAVTAMVASVKWDAVRDAMDPSKYTADLSPVLARATALLNERVAAGALPAVSRFGVWSAIVSHVVERFVEGAARVKKCTVPGRGLMSLDIGTIYANAARVGPVVPGCLARDKSHADAFIAAFYYDTEADLIAWVAKNRAAYPLRNVKALLLAGLGATLKKKPLRDALVAIESLYCIPLDDDERLKQTVMSNASAAGGAIERFGAAMMGAASQ